MLELDVTSPPENLPRFWERVVRLFRSMQDVKHFLDVELVAGAEGRLLRHECRTKPKTATVIVKGASASSAVVTLGPITATFITFYTTADCTVDVEVKL